MNISNYAENLLLNFILNSESATRPTSWYIGVYSDPAGLTGDEPTQELSGNGYSRQAATFIAASGGSLSNSNLITFQATGNWQPANYIGILDGATSGHLLFWGALQSSISLYNGGQILFPINSIKVYMN